ncbi:MAG: hypothetical protein QME25_00875 [Bacteroidota bacterium]|nr:hypothetical protein [Bacteroidota bacterium]
MFESEIDRIIALVIKRTIGSSDNISVKEILGSEIPLPLRTLIRVDVEQKLYEELRNKFVNSRFDFSHPEVVSLQNQMSSFLVLNYVFQRQEYLELVNDSVHLLLNYLIRPQWTLKSFIFDNTTQVSKDEIMRALKHFGAYDYLKEIVIRILNEKNIKLMIVDEFRDLVWKCDSEFIRRKDGYQLAQITSAIYDFINYGKHDAHKSLPTKGLIKFFEDKGLKVAVERLTIELQRNVNEISYEDLSVILEDLRRSVGPFEPKILSPEKPQLENIEGEVSSKPAEVPVEIKPDILEEKDKPELEKSRRVESSTEIKKETDFEPIENFIDEADRKCFIKKIFIKNEKDYTDALAEINDMQSWKQASVYIDEIFILNEIDPYIPEAVRFTELAYKRFFPKSVK